MRLPTLALIVISAAAAVQTQAAEYPKPGLGLLAPVDVNGMTFANSWMPPATGMKSRIQAGIELYARSLGSNPENHHERKPGTPLWGPFKWLMTYDDAMKAMPAPHDRPVEQQIVTDNFPRNSLISVGVHVLNMVEANKHRFDWVYLVLDKQRRVVGVELVATSPKDQEPWLHRNLPPGIQVGIMEPYYDYVNVKSNASTTQRVEYAIEPIHPGVKIIHTALFRGTKCLENVQWYLAGPFARALLQIVEDQHRQGR